MKREQSVLNKLAKFTAKEVELSAQQPIEVELSSIDEIKSILGFAKQTEARLEAWINKRDVYLKNYQSLQGDYSKAQSKLEAAEAEFRKADTEFGAIAKGVKSAEDSLDNANTQVKRNINEYKDFKKAADSAISSFNQKAKELGVEVGSLPEVKALEKVLDSMKRLASNA